MGGKHLNYEHGMHCSSWHLPPSLAYPNPYEVANALTFTVVRHPLTKMLSQYEMAADHEHSTWLNDPVKLNIWLAKTLKHLMKYFKAEIYSTPVQFSNA